MAEIRGGGYDRVVLQGAEHATGEEHGADARERAPLRRGDPGDGRQELCLGTSPRVEDAAADHQCIPEHRPGAVIGGDLGGRGVAAVPEQARRPSAARPGGSHPTLAGSFLGACAAFAVLLGVSSAEVRVDVYGLSAADARPLQRIAGEAASASAASELPGSSNSTVPASLWLCRGCHPTPKVQRYSLLAMRAGACEEAAVRAAGQ